MTIKKIDELNRITLAQGLAVIEDLVIPVKEDQSVNEADGAMLAEFIVVDHDIASSYKAGRRIQFQGQLFQALVDIPVGQDPNTNRSKFRYLGGGITLANTCASSGFTATANFTTALITFDSFTPINPGAHGIFVITNATLIDNTDVEAYITDAIDGFAVIENKEVNAGGMRIWITNTHASETLSEFNLWLNNRA